MMCKKGVISVVLPCYNHEKYIRQSIDSVLAQTYNNIELILLDNGSSDNSWKIIKQYEDKATLIKIPENDINESRKAFRNAVHGEYVAIMTSDDLWAKSKLEKQFNFLETHRDYDACFACTQYFNDTLTEPVISMTNTFHVANRSNTEWIHHFWHNGNCLCCPSAFLRSEVYFEIWERDVAYWQYYDYFAWITLLLKSRSFYILPEVLVHMRKHDGAVSFSEPTGLREFNEFHSIRCEIFEQIPDALFQAAFNKEFQNPDASSHAELTCEKILLMLKDAEENLFFQPLAVDFFYRHYTEPDVQETLRNKYGYDRNYFNEVCVNMGIAKLVYIIKEQQSQIELLTKKTQKSANDNRILLILTEGLSDLIELLAQQNLQTLSINNPILNEVNQVITMIVDCKSAIPDFFQKLPQTTWNKLMHYADNKTEIEVTDLLLNLQKAQAYLEYMLS